MITWVRGTLKISSPTMSAEEIANVMGLAPSRVADKGSLMISGDPQSMRHEKWIWFFESGLSDTSPLEDHIDALLKVLESRKGEVDELSSRCEIDLRFSCQFEHGQGGTTLRHELVSRLARLPINVSLDMYSWSSEPDRMDSDAG